MRDPRDLVDMGPLFKADPPHNGTPTSREAAESMKPHAGTVRGLVYDRIKSKGSVGQTTDEIEEALGLRHQTASARVNELTAKMLIIPSGEVRRTRSGRNAAVYVVRQ